MSQLTGGFVHLDDDHKWRDLSGRFKRAPQQVRVFLSQGVRDITESIASAVVDELPSRSGATRRSVRTVYGQQDGDTVHARVVVGNPVGVLLLTGTRAHVIEPRRGRVLAFPGKGGTTVFARRVHHPGTRPNPYINRALGRFALAAKTVVLKDRVIALLRLA